jgi:hypothetical protein
MDAGPKDGSELCDACRVIIHAYWRGTDINFEIKIINVSGTGLSRAVTAHITNKGSADVHNAWVKAQVFSLGQRIQLSGQDYLKQDLGTFRGQTTVITQATLDFGLSDGLTILQNGAQVLLSVFSDEWTETLTYNYKP